MTLETTIFYITKQHHWRHETILFLHINNADEDDYDDDDNDNNNNNNNNNVILIMQPY